ncbi:MAG TPA: ATP-binding cassette domain-containing protein [Planctomycetes bacterium]|nr:ATP-binding cassette domain-containing protein [Planctomycetota bacterium]
MKGFARVLRLTLRYRFTLAASVVCALAVGLLWGANIGTVYPFIEVAFKNQSLGQWVDGRIAATEEQVDRWSAEVEGLRRRLAEAPPHRRDGLRGQIAAAQVRLEAERKALSRYRWLRPYLHRYLPAAPFPTLALLVVVLLAGTALKSLFVIAHAVLVARLAELSTFDLRKLFFRRTLRMDVATFSTEGTSDLTSRFTYDMQCVVMGVQALVGKLVREPLKMFACLIGAAVICWRLLLLSLVVAPLAALAIGWLAKMLKRSNRRAMEEMAVLYNTLEESFRGIRIVKAFTMERAERRRFHYNSKTYFQKAMKIAQYDALSHPLTEMLGILTICMALLAGAWLVLQGQTHLFGIRMSMRPLLLPDLLLFYAFLAGSADPMRKLSDIFARVQRAAAASDRIYAMIDREPAVRDPVRPWPLARHRESLIFDGVDFAYSPGRLVLRGVDLQIRFGETIGVVGPSGCGKSTLLSLIPRFADPVSGEIRLDGVPIREVRIRDLRKQIGLVTQEPFLFDDTVMNNIRYGAPGASDEEVMEAARRAGAHRFIEEELPAGYQTRIGPLGGLLSGGQRQRVALARAILRNPPILLLDEATSQVDLESERLIQRALDQFVRGRTAIIVTHRLSALALADRIVVMRDGRILDVGPHDELLARCPFYSRLYQIQFEELRETA